MPCAYLFEQISEFTLFCFSEPTYLCISYFLKIDSFVWNDNTYCTIIFILRSCKTFILCDNIYCIFGKYFHGKIGFGSTLASIFLLLFATTVLSSLITVVLWPFDFYKCTWYMHRYNIVGMIFNLTTPYVLNDSTYCTVI